MRAYKVVRRSRGMLVSMACREPRAQIRYRLFHKAKPRKNAGPLCVFDSLLMAKSWVSPRCLIYAAEIERSRAKRIWYPIDEENNYFSRLEHLPPGTILAKSVKLLKRIPR